METTRLALVLFFALVCATCGSGKPETIAGWELAEEPIAVNTEIEFYQQIDGGAPRYIERGWVSSTYATYQKAAGGPYIQAAVHDMGARANAEDMFRNSLPGSRTDISYTDESDPDGRRPNAVVDQGKATTYGSYAFRGRYFFEVAIDAKTDAALADLKAFVLEMLECVQ